MATASAYDQWDDPGLAFTEEDLAGWDVKVMAEERVADLLARTRLALRRAELPDLPMPDLWKEASKSILNAATWWCQAVTIPGVVREEATTLPPADSPEGKALTKEALNAEAAEWLAEWLADVEASLHHLVTIGRRCVTKGVWKGKEKKSLSNKAANALMKEYSLITKLEAMLESKSG